MTSRNALTLPVLGLLLAIPAATHARRQSHADKGNSSAVQTLLGGLKWGLTSEQVIAHVVKQVSAGYSERLAKEKDPLQQDQIRRQRDAEIKKVQSTLIHFRGTPTPWDVSLVDDEFAHRNDESMLVRWTRRDRRFYFFHHNRLWKLYIAFNADLYRDKTFEDFAALMERRFGPAERKYKANLKGEAVMSHLQWPSFGNTTLIALDNTGFYGNFCLVLLDRQRAAKVQAARRAHTPTHRRGDPLVGSAIRPASSDIDVNSDIVDRITGGSPGKPPANDTEQSGTQPEKPGSPGHP